MMDKEKFEEIFREIIDEMIADGYLKRASVEGFSITERGIREARKRGIDC